MDILEKAQQGATKTIKALEHITYKKRLRQHGAAFTGAEEAWGVLPCL